MPLDPRSVLAALSVEHAVSGSALAARFGVTRAAVWKQIEALRELGAPIDAAVGSGYRLTWPLELLDGACISDQIDPAMRARLAGLKVHWRIDSTSSELRRHAEKTAISDAVRVCVAEAQSAGRGRRGRIWQSPLGGNVYFSLFRHFERGMGALAGLSLAAGVALIEALTDCGVSGVGLKWPNDVLADGSKLAGVLVELGGEFLGPCHAVIGIGINVHLPATTRAQIDQPAIDLASLCNDVPPSRNRLVARLIVRLVAALDRFVEHGFAAFRDDYTRYDLLRDRALRVTAADSVHEGIAAGVDERGALLVRRNGELFRYDSADVSVRSK